MCCFYYGYGVFMKNKVELLVSLLVVSWLFSSYANANAAAVVAMQNRLKENDQSINDSSLIVANDGFKDVKAFFRKGPEFRFCDLTYSELRYDSVRVVSNNGVFSCKNSVFVKDRNSKFNGGEWVDNDIEDLSAQEFLDRLYPGRVLKYVGLSGRVQYIRGSKDSQTVSIFYKIIK